jgi:uncharacterized protein YbjT (DUF2867 family)
MRKLDVLVVGSTGRQGGAVAAALLAAGHHVRAMTRNLAHPAANALRLRGARLAWADLDDERRVRDSLQGADAVFVIMAAAPGDAAAAVRRTLTLAELARQHDVGHAVFSLCAGPAGASGPPGEVEQYARAIRLPHTFVRPAFIMESLLAPPLLARLRNGELALPVPHGTPVQQLALADFGRFVRVALERRADFLGRDIHVAGDELTPAAMAATLARVLGQPIRFAAAPPAAAAQSPQSPAAGRADVARLRRDYPLVDWHTLEGWARRQDWRHLGTTVQERGAGA